MGKLTQLPNIGPVLEGNLEKIGVTSAEELAAIGAEQAFLRIRSEVAPTACINWRPWPERWLRCGKAGCPKNAKRN